MVQDEDEWRVLPDARSTTDRAAARLSICEKEPDEVALLAAHPGIAGLEPQPGTRIATG